MRQGFVEHLFENSLSPHRALHGEDVTDDLVTVEVGGWPSFTEAEGKSREVDGRVCKVDIFLNYYTVVFK